MTPTPEDHSTPKPEWFDASERGSRILLNLVVWGIRRLGSAPLRLLIGPIALYYFVFDGHARRASQRYLLRVGAYSTESSWPERWIQSYRHFRSFAEMIHDRLTLWGGDPNEISVTLNEPEKVRDLLQKHGGAFMAGAHLGNFDVLRVIARDAEIPVNVLMFTANAVNINAAFETLDPESQVRIIPVSADAGDSPGVTLGIRRHIAAGEFVAAMSDRVRPGAERRVAEVDFLGDRALFPVGVFHLAAVLGAPVLLTLALRTGPRQYEVFIETLSEGTQRVAPSERKQVLEEQLQAFAHRLEDFCRQAPHQWFNFYDFWKIPKP